MNIQNKIRKSCGSQFSLTSLAIYHAGSKHTIVISYMFSILIHPPDPLEDTEYSPSEGIHSVSFLTLINFTATYIIIVTYAIVKREK